MAKEIIGGMVSRIFFFFFNILQLLLSPHFGMDQVSCVNEHFQENILGWRILVECMIHKSIKYLVKGRTVEKIFQFGFKVTK